MPRPSEPPAPQMQRPPDLDQGWTRVTAPELHKWNKPGDSVYGRLLSIEKIEIERKLVLQYIVAPTNTHRVKFLGTYDLAQKLTAAHRGMLVKVTYLGEDESVSRNGNAMKVFDVQVRKDPDAPDVDRGPITDEDIPF